MRCERERNQGDFEAFSPSNWKTRESGTGKVEKGRSGFSLGCAKLDIQLDMQVEVVIRQLDV